MMFKVAVRKPLLPVKVSSMPEILVSIESAKTTGRIAVSSTMSQTKQKYTPMKTIILFAVAINLLSPNNLSAQKNSTVDYAVTESFTREFKHATHVEWSKPENNITMARFDNHGEHYIAYFTSAGELVLTGRRIPFEITPLPVRERTEEIRSDYGKKGNEMTIREVYELSGNSGTEYFINFTSEKLALSVIVYGTGTSKVLRKSNQPSVNDGMGVLAASTPKKN
jgi:hypothetical protein